MLINQLLLCLRRLSLGSVLTQLLTCPSITLIYADGTRSFGGASPQVLFLNKNKMWSRSGLFIGCSTFSRMNGLRNEWPSSWAPRHQKLEKKWVNIFWWEWISGFHNCVSTSPVPRSIFAADVIWRTFTLEIKYAVPRRVILALQTTCGKNNSI